MKEKIMGVSEHLDIAKKTFLLRGEKVDINSSITSYQMYIRNSQSYGVNLQRKLIHDSMGILKPCNPKIGRGDAYISTNDGNFYYELYYEIKTSYLTHKGLYNVTHIRLEQKFDYYIICLYDTSDDFKGRYYVLPKSFITNGTFKLNAMNGNVESNKNNKNIDMRFSIKSEDAYRLFGENNILAGTSYNDLISYYLSIGLSWDVEHANMMKQQMVKESVDMTMRCYQPKTIISLVVDGVFIQGTTNRDTIMKFIRHIGITEAVKFFPDTWLSRFPGTYHTIKLDLGYHFNNKLSIRDIRNCIRRGGKKNSRLNVKLVERS